VQEKLWDYFVSNKLEPNLKENQKLLKEKAL
jgi:hypothetical protein